MGKKNTNQKRNGFNTQKIFKYVRWAGLALPAAGIALSGDSTESKIHQGTLAYFGYNNRTGKMQWGSLVRGWGPYLGAVVTTYGIPKLVGMIRGG